MKFPQALKSGHFRIPQFVNGIIPFRLGVAVNRRFLVAHAEKRGLENVNKSTNDNVGKKAEETGDQEISDVQPIHVGVRRKNHFSVAKTLHRLLDVQRAHQIENLIVLIDDGAIQIPNVQRLTFERKYGLEFGIATTGNRPRSRLTFGDEDHRLVPGLLFKVQVNLAIFELRYPERDRRGSFPGEFTDVLKLFAKSLGFLEP